MLIAVEEHDRHRIVELVHRVEIRDLVDVAEVDDGEICAEQRLAVVLLDDGRWQLTLHTLGDLVKDFVLTDAWWRVVRLAIARRADATYSRDRGRGQTGSPRAALPRKEWPGRHAKLFAGAAERSNPWRWLCAMRRHWTEKSESLELESLSIAGPAVD